MILLSASLDVGGEFGHLYTLESEKRLLNTAHFFFFQESNNAVACLRECKSCSNYEMDEITSAF